MQKFLDREIKRTGHQNAYFPLFIPLSFLEKEAAHVEGFAKECAVVTHHRLEEKDGKLIPTGELEEPLIVRPTSETIIGEAFSRWVESYRDLPLLINQWANVVRWEMRPRLLLRTAEFLWQEGHTAHATEKEAVEETLKMLEVYRSFMEDVLALPVIVGQKPECERFPGAVNTYTLEAMMQDRKALQAGTSHYLGQNFAKGSNIKFSNAKGELEYAYTTSWGVTTRMIGAVVMCHGDDDGIRIPPRISQTHIVIIPFIPKEELQAQVIEYAEKVAAELRSTLYHGDSISVIVDKRDKRGGDKSWEWIKKGVPLRIEIGPKEMESGQVAVMRRDRAHKEKTFLAVADLKSSLCTLLDEMQTQYYKEAKAYRDQSVAIHIENVDQFKAFFHPDQKGGFVRAKWSGDEETLKILDDLKVTIRCLPLDQTNTIGKCVLSGKPATQDAIFAKAY